MLSGAFLGQEAPEPVGEDEEQDCRLLGGHRRAGELLVGERGQPPEARCVRVVAVDRAREQCEQEPQRRGEDEGGECVRGPEAARQASRAVLDERPPDEDPRAEVARVLEVDQRALVMECAVVDDRYVPDVVVRQPDRQSDGGMGEDAPRRAA